MNRFLNGISRYILGVVFVFSGFVKCVDPVGLSIKFEEYFLAFNMDWMAPMADVFAVVLPTVELLLGFLVLFGMFKRINSWIMLVLSSFFALLTLYIFIFNPVTDCGCFGDAIKISNGSTFAKNVVLLALAIIYFRGSKEKIVAHSHDYYVLALLFVWAIMLPLFSLLYLPVMHFTPYELGKNIPQLMSIPKDAPEGEYKTKLLYKNKTNNEQKLFELTDTTWYDTSTWEYVETINEVVKEGYVPPIAAFNIVDSSGVDVSSQLLSHPNYLETLVVSDLSKLNRRVVKHNIKNLLKSATENNLDVVVFTPNNIAKTAQIIYEITGRNIACYNLDEKILKTYIRTSVGVVVLKKGTIIAKCNLLREKCDYTDERLNLLPGNVTAIVYLTFIIYFFVVAIFGWYVIFMRKRDDS